MHWIRTPDRLHHILLPLLNSLAIRDNISSTPDLVSFSAGFWGLMRMSYADSATRTELLAEGHSEAEKEVARLGQWTQMSEGRMDFIKLRIEQSLLAISLAWPSMAGAAKTTQFLFRTSICCGLTRNGSTDLTLLTFDMT